MISPAFRLVFVTLIVSLYAVAQAFCACAAVMTTDLGSHHASHMQDQIGSEHAHMGHTKKDPSSPACEHCEDGVNSAVVENVTLAPAVKIVPIRVKFAVIVRLDNGFVERAEKSYGKLRWLDPPPALTPITLKTRLLT